MAAHGDLLHLYLTVENNTYGEQKVVCESVIPNCARKHLNMLNENCKPDAALEKFEIYFNEQLHKRKIYWSDKLNSFRVNRFNITINDGWLPARHFKMRTPNIITHRSEGGALNV